MRITIDCRHNGSSGIGVYLRECLRCFLKTGHDFILLGERRQIEELIEQTGACNTLIAECAVPPFSVRELCFFPRALLKLINSGGAYWTPYINIPCGITVPVYATIHDVIFFDIPGIVSKAGVLLRRFFFRRAVRQAAAIFTVSEFSKKRIQTHFGGNLRVIVTYSAVKPSIAQWHGPYPPKKRRIIFVGTVKKHKGLSLLIEAFTALRREGFDYTLCIAGSARKLRSADRLAQNSIEDGAPVEWFDNIDDARLRILMSEAALLVQPSFYEGFGLPPLEALSLGTAVLISDIPVFKEIYDEFPVTYFHSGDSASLRDKMRELLYTARETQSAARITLTEELRERYTFEKTARVIMEEICRTH